MRLSSFILLTTALLIHGITADEFLQPPSSVSTTRRLKGKKDDKPNKDGRKPGSKADKPNPGSKGKDQQYTYGDMTIKVKGKSGKFTVDRNKMGKDKKTQSKVDIQIDSLTEVDANGKAVGTKGKIKHSVKSLAKTEFSFTIAEENVDAGANATAKAMRVTFASSLDTGSKLQVETLLISGKGEVNTPTENWIVQPVYIKFNILLSNWVFASTVKFVDIELEIKGKNSLAQKRTKKLHDHDEHKDTKDKDDRRSLKGKTDKSWDLGDGAILELSDQILVDGNWTTMPDGYPSYEQKGGKQIYTFRFPKFTDTAFYDPIVGFDSSVEGSYASSGTRSASLSMSTLLVLIVGVVFGMIGGTVGMVSL